MKVFRKNFRMILLAAVMVGVLAGCGKNRDGGRPLVTEPVEGPPVIAPGNPEIKPNGIFSYKLGSVVPDNEKSLASTELNGLTICDDYDGDGIKNNDEITTNPYVAEYPKIVTRISAPITMEIRISATNVSENHSETVEDSGVTDTITNSMEDRQYASVNDKTMPYTSKESSSESQKDAGAWGYTDATSSSVNVSLGGGFFDGVNFNSSYGTTESQSKSRNESWDKMWSKSTSSEKLAFTDAHLVDTLDKNGTAFTSEAVEKMTKNSRKSINLNAVEKQGPNDGVVRASLFIKNETVNIPSRISNLKCTLTFRTPSGKFLPVKTFLLRNEDYSLFEQDVYGAEELGPYTVELSGLNTQEVSNALKNGFIPQIHIVSYDLSRVKDSKYNPGVDNLKIIEENAKGRSAYITVSASGVRESYRVCAFDVDANGKLSPGISLKKALFNIFKSRAGRSESWEYDSNRNPLTVTDNSLKWKSGSADPYNHTYGSNISGNKWAFFETCVKSYVDEFNISHNIESIKRINSTVKYNPFDKKDNPGYDPNDLLSESEIRKMKYWYVMHDGRYYEGDINDPIWVGERYEIVCVDVDDLNEHYKNFVYTPLQSLERIAFNTRWNYLSDVDPFARGKYMGKLFKDDIVTLEIDLKETRFITDPLQLTQGIQSVVFDSRDLPYAMSSLDTKEESTNGALSDFHYSAEGGANNIRVQITNSDNASEYEIILSIPGGEKKYRITKNALAERGNNFIIYRKTKDISDTETGYLGKGIYYIRVKAIGTLYDVPVFHEALEKKTSVEVVNPAEGIPGDYSFSSSGDIGLFSLNISEGVNTEFYQVRITGPLNMPGGYEMVREVPASSGYNSYTVDPPPGFNDYINNNVPGVYEINVYPVNNNCITTYSQISAYSEKSQFVSVSFEKYKKQKSQRAKKYNRLSMKEAVNLEVNFNDGSGWYKLKLFAADKAVQSIDCLYSNYFDYKNQKFFIAFKPPVGGGTNLYNVFSGGRDTVDLFIRTEPREEYRDRFWPVNSNFVNGISPVITFASAQNYFHYWVFGGYHTDATRFDEIMASPSSVSPGYTITNSVKDNFFFSPYEYRVYNISATLSGNMMELAEKSKITPPAFEADTAGNNVINLKSIRSSDSTCNEFLIYYKPVYDVPASTADTTVLDKDRDHTIIQALMDENVTDWNKAGSISVKSDGSKTIQGVLANVNYAVAVIGKNANGFYSSPSYLFAQDGQSVRLMIPRNRFKPGSPDNFALNILGDGKTIRVSSIYAENATRYVVMMRNLTSAWSQIAELPADPVKTKMYDITSAGYWDSYLVRVIAFNDFAPSGINSSESKDAMISTQFNNAGLAVSAVEWTGLEKIYDQYISNANYSFFIKANVAIDVAKIPENAVKSRFNLKIFLNGYSYASWDSKTINSDYSITLIPYSFTPVIYSSEPGISYSYNYIDYNIEYDAAKGGSIIAPIGFTVYKESHMFVSTSDEAVSRIDDYRYVQYELYLDSYVNKNGQEVKVSSLAKSGKIKLINPDNIIADREEW